MYETLSSTSIGVSLFDLKYTFESAQPLAFHADYNAQSNTLTYASGAHIINVGAGGSVDRGTLLVVGKDIGYAAREVARRFRLGDNMRSIYRQIATDSFVKASIEKYKGMRITLNDPWETTLCFIISQFNNVKRIRLITKNILRTFGPSIKDDRDNVVANSFPEPGSLANATIKELMACGTGFRAKYIKDAADYCANNLDLSSLRTKGYAELKEELMRISGVGDKVADCIALFGYGNTHAFPIDVWMQRAMERTYFNGKKTSARKIHEFAEERWGAYAGFAQQYIYHYARSSRMGAEAKRSRASNKYL